MSEEQDGVTILNPAVSIDLDNYKPYSNVTELRKKAIEYLKTLKEQDFAIGESGLTFRFFKKGIEHILSKTGITKILITKQLTDIFNQAHILIIKPPKESEEKTVDSVVVCGTYIMIKGLMYYYIFNVKKYKDGKTLIYSGNINIQRPEIEKTESDELRIVHKN